ncbi:MAG: hypothetical protein IPK22_18180 [Verrucomicrobiaceae bacterium]|nr:hypothetical protein [Verrucomicrobiaceae bacterium]
MSLRHKIQHWAVQASGVLFTQVGVQGIGAVTGLMLVRWMPKDEYAWLTICGSLLATIGLLADGGIATAITSMSGRVVGDRNALAQVADASLSVRNRLALLSLVLTLPPFYILFTRTEMSPSMAALVVGSAAVMLWPVTSSKFLPVTLRIAGHLKSTQIMELSGALLRCGLTAIVLVIGWRQVYPAFLATVASIGLHAWLARRGVSRVAGVAPGTDGQRAEVWGFVRALYANHIFFCVQGQIATWIISFSSGVTEIADIGALSRLTVFFSIFGAMFHYMVLPNVASTKCPVLVRTKFIVSISGTFGAVLLVIGASWLFPRPVFVHSGWFGLAFGDRTSAGLCGTGNRRDEQRDMDLHAGARLGAPFVAEHPANARRLCARRLGGRSAQRGRRAHHVWRRPVATTALGGGLCVDLLAPRDRLDET